MKRAWDLALSLKWTSDSVNVDGHSMVLGKLWGQVQEESVTF